MPRTKSIDTEDTKKSLSGEKILEVEEVDLPLDTEDKPDPVIAPEVEVEEDELTEDEAALDTEEIDPFGDTWEQ